MRIQEFPWATLRRMVCFLWLSCPTPLFAQTTELPPSLRQSLGRFSQLSTFSVSYTYHYDQTPAAVARLKQNSRISSQSHGAYLVWQNGKMYSRRVDGGTEWKDNPNTPRTESAFDGTILRFGCPDRIDSTGQRRHPVMAIAAAEDNNPYSEYFGVSSLDHLGARLPHGSRELLTIQSLSSELLYLVETGGQVTSIGSESISGHQYTRIAVLIDNPQWVPVQAEDLKELEKNLRGSHSNSEETIQEKLEIVRRLKRLTPKKIENVFFLDPDHSFAVRRWQERTESGLLQHQLDGSNVQQLPGHDLWLPRDIRVDSYVTGTLPGETFDIPIQTLIVNVSEYNTKAVPDSQFALEYSTPGTLITDHTLPEAKLGQGGVTYRVPVNPDDLGQVITEARESTRLAAERRSWETMKTILIGVNVLIVILVIVYLVRRYRRKGSQA